MKKLLSVILCLVVLFGATTTFGYAGTSVKAFSDVPASRWSYDAIMKMVDKGLFNGKTPPDASGVGSFAPEDTMTRAEFITVVVRYLYPSAVESMSAKLNGAGGASTWYTVYHQVAVEQGLLKKSELGGHDGMTKNMNRQEMAMVLSRACDVLNEVKGSVISNYRIPDYESIGTAYRWDVRVVYTKGLITGVDQHGTFAPLATLTREQASTVLYRLTDPSARVKVDDGVLIPGVAEEGTSWVEGEHHEIKDVKVGATVIKKDGTRVVLTATKVRDLTILGYGQGVDPYSGIPLANGSVAKEGTASWYDYSPWIYDKITGSMHSDKEWQAIESATFPGREPGAYDGEVRNLYWKWSTEMNEWLYFGPF